MRALIVSVAVLLLPSGILYSQPVTESIMFDYYTGPGDNDFVNNFSGGLGLTQITTNGISGGCLTTPSTVNWGNDNAVYCSKYIDSASYSSNTKISFKYDTTQINTINFDRAVSIFLRPNADFNHYLIASVTHDKKIQIVSYFAGNNPVPVTLVHNHWYDFILSTSFTTPAPVYQITSSVQLNDLGVTGQTPPIPAGNSNLSFTDSLLYVDTAVQVSFTASMWGGAKYVDNFQFQGMKSADSCNTATAVPSIKPDEFNIYIHENDIHFTYPHTGLTFHLYLISGQMVFSGKVPPGHSSFPLPDIENGVYLIQVSGSSDSFHRNKKVVLIR